MQQFQEMKVPAFIPRSVARLYVEAASKIHTDVSLSQRGKETQIEHFPVQTCSSEEELPNIVYDSMEKPELNKTNAHNLETEMDEDCFSQKFNFDSSECLSFMEAVDKCINPPLVNVESLSTKKLVPCFSRSPPKQLSTDTSISRLFRGKVFYQYCDQNFVYTNSASSAIEQSARRYSTSTQKHPLFDQNYSTWNQGALAKRRRIAEEDEGLQLDEYQDTGRNNVKYNQASSRSWEYTSFGNHYLSQGGTLGLDFTVMSYNVLAQSLLEDNIWLYQKSEQACLDWSYRRNKLMEELRYHRPDIICLQEVEENHYNDFILPCLKGMGYSGMHLKRDGRKTDGCATFYKEKKFSLVDYKHVHYFQKDGGDVLDRDNVALLAKLRDRRGKAGSEDTICVANTHLLFNPRRGDIKLAQTVMLLAEIDRFAYMGHNSASSYHSVVMCGDFNSEPGCDLYKLITRGCLEYEGLLCRLISGQKEGQMKGRNVFLSRDFLPKKLGISDQCQYIQDVLHRVTCNISNSEDDCIIIEDEPEMSTAEETDVVYVDSRNRDRHSTSPCSVPQGGITQGSGTVSHGFHLHSSYEHSAFRRSNKRGVCREVTTCHSKAHCTVDYIFYGEHRGHATGSREQVQHSEKAAKQKGLALVGRYGLLTSSDFHRLGIRGLPNMKLPSDHLSLIARFLLR